MLDAPEQREKAYEELCRGWDVGTEEGKLHLAGKVQNGEARANAELQKELLESRWRDLLKMGLDALGKKPEDLKYDLKSADWKVALGAWIKSQSGATNRWLGEICIRATFIMSASESRIMNGTELRNAGIYVVYLNCTQMPKPDPVRFLSKLHPNA